MAVVQINHEFGWNMTSGALLEFFTDETSLMESTEFVTNNLFKNEEILNNVLTPLEAGDVPPFEVLCNDYCYDTTGEDLNWQVCESAATSSASTPPVSTTYLGQEGNVDINSDLNLNWKLMDSQISYADMLQTIQSADWKFDGFELSTLSGGIASSCMTVLPNIHPKSCDLRSHHQCQINTCKLAAECCCCHHVETANVSVYTNRRQQQGIKLWQFVLIQLDDETCRHLIQWICKSKRSFCIVNTEGLARLWGIYKKRYNMNYQKFSRALRTYYKKNILKKLPEKFCYQFNQFPELWEFETSLLAKPQTNDHVFPKC